MYHQCEIFIRYSRTYTEDKAEHLKDLFESRYKKRLSFKSLLGLFDVFSDLAD